MGYIFDIIIDWFVAEWMEKIRRSSPVLFWTINLLFVAALIVLIALVARLI